MQYLEGPDLEQFTGEGRVKKEEEEIAQQNSNSQIGTCTNSEKYNHFPRSVVGSKTF